jgi:hypothetical protein
MIQWALSVDSCLRRNDRIWIIDIERGKINQPRQAVCGGESYDSMGAIDRFLLAQERRQLAKI